ncbi:hypothetical protein [Acinetobacter bereziniae]|uniref:hypothetical protein n=1 Tax=Acinetobacter bereziniae TaxID=106648 RepID=UPI002955079C|nr:hypothetical protein [Acinetobacter bereziniae]MDV8155665.1 hypothetical protein [Acinetobacter bereziniae]
MKAIDQDFQKNVNLNQPYQINNFTPEKQAILLQNTNKDLPIQIRVDSVTDYTALWITVFASIIASFIGALVTILLVKDSNKNLVKTQNEAQENLFSIQKKELNTKNRTERLNQIREHASNINLSSNLLPRMLLDINLYKYHPSSSLELGNRANTDFHAELKNFMKYNYNLRLYLVDKSDGERLIISLIEEFITTLTKIFPNIFYIETYVSWNDFLEHYDGKKLKILSDKIAYAIEDYIKDEWDKILKLSE